MTLWLDRLAPSTDVFEPWTKMRSLRMAIDPYPAPRPAVDHSIGGPAGGHCCSRPVSLDRPVRSGPCHCGQSNSDAGGAAGAAGRDACGASAYPESFLPAIR